MPTLTPCDVRIVPLVRSRAPAREGLHHVLARLAATVARMVRAYRAARLLHEMPDHMLKDIGISRGDIDTAVRHGRPWRDEANGVSPTMPEGRELPR